MINITQIEDLSIIYGYLNPILNSRIYIPKIPFSEIKGFIVIIPGYTAHSGVHNDLCEYLSKRGYVVTAGNLRGHGTSHGPRFSVKSFEEYAGDITRFLTRFFEHIPDLPNNKDIQDIFKEKKLHVIGHSHGALAAHYTCEKATTPMYFFDDGTPVFSEAKHISSLTLICPYYELNNKNYKLLKTLSSVFSYIMPNFLIPTGGQPEDVIDNDGTEGNMSGNNILNIENARWDVLAKGDANFVRMPLIPFKNYFNGSRFTFSWMNASAKAQDYVSNNTKISIPMQFITADNDTVAVNSTTEKMFDKLKSNNPKNIFQKFNGKHDLLRCLVREEVFESILQFIESVKN